MRPSRRIGESALCVAASLRDGDHAVASAALVSAPGESLRGQGALVRTRRGSSAGTESLLCFDVLRQRF